MNHFLTRLVERAHGIAPRVEPIITPRFAPPPITEIATEIDAPVSVPSRETHLASRSQAPGRKIVTQEIERPQPEETRRHEAPGRSEPEQLLVPQEIVVSHPAAPVVRRIAPEDVSVPSAPNGSRRMEFAGDAPATRPGSAPPTTTRTLVAGGVDPGPPGVKHSNHRVALQPNELSSEPPIVRVTIGRIDVRAETPVPSPRRKSSTRSEPKLTLDAYLKSRKEGRP